MNVIVAMGGGGFSQTPDDLRLDAHILAMAARARPQVCFLPTASGDAEGYIDRFISAMTSLDARPSVLRLFKRNITDLRTFALSQDLIYVGGGNTANMLAVWRAHGLDTILRDAYQAGVLLCGLSAGMICWFEQSLTDSYGGLAALPDGLGLLPGSACPHFSDAPGRRNAFEEAVAAGSLQPGVACDNGAAVVYRDGQIEQVVVDRPEASAYTVTAAGSRQMLSKVAV